TDFSTENDQSARYFTTGSDSGRTSTAGSRIRDRAWIAWFDPAQEKATVRFLPRARRVEISSDAQPETVIERLRRLVADWRGSPLAAAALQAGISGWSIEERRDLLVLRPRPTERGSPLVIFEGIVQKSPSGSSISGRIRLHPLARLLLVVVAVMAAAGPIRAPFETVPRGGWPQHGGRARPIPPISLLIPAGRLPPACRCSAATSSRSSTPLRKGARLRRDEVDGTLGLRGQTDRADPGVAHHERLALWNHDPLPRPEREHLPAQPAPRHLSAQLAPRRVPIGAADAV